MSEICALSHLLFDELKPFAFPFEPSQIPRNGIYVLFEAGEYAHGVNRVVRVGTHTGNNQLRARLQQHFIRENKDRSIFRKNIGRTILNRENDPFIEQWEWDLTTRKAKNKYGHLVNWKKQREVETLVTQYIQGSFSFVVFEVLDSHERLRLESRIISTISLCDECHPSSEWLGQYSPKAKIRESGLWLVNELYKQPMLKPDYITLEHCVGKTNR
jgi:hypothetical protein